MKVTLIIVSLVFGAFYETVVAAKRHRGSNHVNLFSDTLRKKSKRSYVLENDEIVFTDDEDKPDDKVSLADSAPKKQDSLQELPSEQKEPSNFCPSNYNSVHCACHKSCLPNRVYTYDPCQCIEQEEQASDQQRSGSQEMYKRAGVELYPNIANPMIDASNIAPFSYVKDYCARECILSPNNPPNVCNCPSQVSQTFSFSPLPSGFLQPQTSGLYADFPASQPSTFNKPIDFLSPMAYSNNVMLYDGGPFTQSNFIQAEAPYVDLSRTAKCKKACFPYTISMDAPCTCNFETLHKASEDVDFLPMNAQSYSSLTNYAESGLPYTRNEMVHRKTVSKKNKKNVTEGASFVTDRGKYLGCFKDEKSPGRDLKISVSIDKLTIEKCVLSCRNKKKKFAGLQNGYLCFCGSRFGRYGRVDDKNCSHLCVGDKSSVCGGLWYNSVYSTDSLLYSEDQFAFDTPDPIDERKIVPKKVKKKSAYTKLPAKPPKSKGKVRKVPKKPTYTVEITPLDNIKKHYSATKKRSEETSRKDFTKKLEERLSKNMAETSRKVRKPQDVKYKGKLEDEGKIFKPGRLPTEKLTTLSSPVDEDDEESDESSEDEKLLPKVGPEQGKVLGNFPSTEKSTTANLSLPVDNDNKKLDTDKIENFVEKLIDKTSNLTKSKVPSRKDDLLTTTEASESDTDDDESVTAFNGQTETTKDITIAEVTTKSSTVETTVIAKEFETAKNNTVVKGTNKRNEFLNKIKDILKRN